MQCPNFPEFSGNCPRSDFMWRSVWRYYRTRVGLFRIPSLKEESSCPRPQYEISSPERTFMPYCGFCDLNQIKSKSWSLIGHNDNLFYLLNQSLQEILNLVFEPQFLRSTQVRVYKQDFTSRWYETKEKELLWLLTSPGLFRFL